MRNRRPRDTVTLRRLPIYTGRDTCLVQILAQRNRRGVLFALDAIWHTQKTRTPKTQVRFHGCTSTRCLHDRFRRPTGTLRASWPGRVSYRLDMCDVLCTGGREARTERCNCIWLHRWSGKHALICIHSRKSRNEVNHLLSTRVSVSQLITLIQLSLVCKLLAPLPPLTRRFELPTTMSTRLFPAVHRRRRVYRPVVVGGNPLTDGSNSVKFVLCQYLDVAVCWYDGVL